MKPPSFDHPDPGPLHPKIADVLERIARTRRPEFHQQSPQQARAAYESSASILDLPAIPLYSVEDFTIPARDGHALPVRLYTPRDHGWAEPLPLLVYFHGGGFVVGSIRTHDSLCRMLAAEADCRVLSVDYRLAPEHKFPTAVNDAFDVLRWASTHAQAIGTDPERIAVGGDSAGGTLATVCAVLARDAGLKLAFQLLLYPGTSAHQNQPSHIRHGRGKLLTREVILWFYAHYIRDETDRRDWRLGPLDAQGEEGQVGADVHGIAPAWIAVAEHDPLVDEGFAYGHKLEAGGVPVTVRHYDGMIHDFFKMGRYVEDVGLAHRDAVRALRDAFGLD